jgi:hypothetical protein
VMQIGHEAAEDPTGTRPGKNRKDETLLFSEFGFRIDQEPHSKVHDQRGK